MTPSTTIVIPTYNGGTRAAQVLRGLADCEIPPGGLEILVIDNASTEDVASTLTREQAWRDLLNLGVRCRVISEPVSGLTRARLRGLTEATSDVICFLDDDTIPCERYLIAGLAALRDPGVGMLTSRVYPCYEVEPPPAIARREHMLAINYRLGDAPLDWGADATVAPTIGAGMWIRRQALEAALASPAAWLWLADRTADALSSGGDIEFGVMVGAAGYRRMYVPELRLEHLIPARRVEMRYFKQLVASVVRSHLALIHRYPPQPWTWVDRWRAIATYCGAVAAVPVLLLRKDGWRETSLVLTARRAAVDGPARADRK